ncbi:hypothetical protein [Caudoviricetes sp.]|nr:hypothetical protein [Caudoviricetes sp.]
MLQSPERLNTIFFFGCSLSLPLSYIYRGGLMPLRAFSFQNFGVFTIHPV